MVEGQQQHLLQTTPEKVRGSKDTGLPETTKSRKLNKVEETDVMKVFQDRLNHQQ